LLKISGLVAGVIIVVAIFTTLYQQNQEQFMSMAVLGEYAKASNYFPNNSTSITTQTQVQWYLQIYNHMSMRENILVKVSLLNSTDVPPDDLYKTPSMPTSNLASSVFMQIPLTLAPNETRLVPFTFRIAEIIPAGSSLRVTQIEIGYHLYIVNTKQSNGTQLRLIFELWSYDSSNELVFSWKAESEESSKHIVWNQMWFRVTT
jgi:hypothetical protein